MSRHEVFQEQISTLNFVIFHWRSHQPSVNVHVLHIEGSFEVTRWRSYYELVWYFVRIHHVHFLAREQFKTVKCHSNKNWTRQILRRAVIWERFFTRQINPRSLGSRCVEETEESTLEVDSSIPLTHYHLKDLGLIC